MKKNPIPEELIAPCGMNCALCSRYLAHVNDLKKSHCIGCRSKNEPCSYLFKKCSGINHSRLTGSAEFCFKCNQYPCKQINRMDTRYRKNYKMSVKDNLDCIQREGVDEFIVDQHGKHRCTKCGNLISIHNKKCFQCDQITKLIEK